MMVVRPIVVGSNHYNTLGLIRSLGESGFKPILILVSTNIKPKKCFVLKSCYITEYRICSRNDIVKTLLEINDSKSTYIVFPAGDSYANIIDGKLDSFPNNYILPNIDRIPGEIINAGDKESLRERAYEYGFRTPQTCLLNVNEELPDDIIYPCILKALHSDIAGKDFGIYRNADELRQAVKRISSKADVIQIQSFIEKENEIIYLGWSHGGEVQIPCVMTKIREYPEKFGCTGLGIFSPDINRYFQIEKLKNLIRSYNYSGLFSVEFLISRGEPYFLEINFRNDGNGYFPGYGGVNIPATFISRIMGNKTSRDLIIQKPFQMMREFTDLEYVCHHKGYYFLTWLKDIRETDVFQIWNKEDPKPFWRIILNKIHL